MQKKKPRAGKVVLFFIIATIILYYIYLHQVLPMPLIIFLIGLGIIISISIGVMVYPEANEWKEFPVIPIRRKK